MKNILLCVFLSILFFACKADPEVAERMDRAETLLTSDPDSAYALLDRIELPDKLNERQFARWCMLYCRAADKTRQKYLLTVKGLSVYHSIRV